MLEIKPATTEDVRSFYGEVPRTMKAIAVKDGERVLGVAGLFRQGAITVLFSDMIDDLKKSPKTIVKAAKVVMKMANGTVVAKADDRYETAPAFLQHLGFRHLVETYYIWHS